MPKKPQNLHIYIIVFLGFLLHYYRFILSPTSFLFGLHNDNFIIVNLHYQQVTRFIAGIFSFWDPNQFYCIASVNLGQLFYPPYLLVDYILSIVLAQADSPYTVVLYSYIFISLLHHFLSFYFFYIFCRQIHFSNNGSLLAACIYSFAAYNIINLALIPRLPLLMLIPLYMFFTAKYLERKNLGYLYLNILVTIFMLLNTYVQALPYVFPFIVLIPYLKESYPLLSWQNVKAMLLIIAPMLIGFAAMYFQTTSFLDIKEYTNRGDFALRTLHLSLSPMYYIVHSLFPFLVFHGNDIGRQIAGHITESSFYIGLSLWVLLLYAKNIKDRRFIIPLILLVACIFLSSAKHFFFADLYYTASHSLFRYPIRAVFGIPFYSAFISGYIFSTLETADNHWNVRPRLLISIASSAVALFIFLFIFALNRGHVNIYLFDQLAIVLLFFSLFSLSIYLIINLNKRIFGYSLFFALFFVDILSYNYKILPIWRYGDVNYFRTSFFDIYNNAMDEDRQEMKILFNHRFYVWDPIGVFLPDYSNLQPTIKGHSYAIPNHINTLFSYFGSVGNKAQYDLYTNLPMSQNINHELWNLLNVKYFCVGKEIYDKQIQSINLALDAIEAGYIRTNNLDYLVIDKIYYPEILVGKDVDLIRFDINKIDGDLLLRVDSDDGTRQFRLLTGGKAIIENKNKSELKLSFSDNVILSNIEGIVGHKTVKAILKVKKLSLNVLMYVDSSSYHCEIYGNSMNSITPQQINRMKAFRSSFPRVEGDNYFYKELETYYGQLFPVSRINTKYLIKNTDAQERLFSASHIIFYTSKDDLYAKLLDTFHAPARLRNIAYVSDRYKHTVNNYRRPADISSYQSIFDGQGYQVSIKNRNEKCHILIASPYTSEWISFSASDGGEKIYNKIIPVLGGTASMVLVEPNDSGQIMIKYDFERKMTYLFYTLMIIILITVGGGVTCLVRKLKKGI